MAAVDAAVAVAAVVVAEVATDMIYRSFTIQWHITDVCNRRCIHCYQDNYAVHLSVSKFSVLLQKLISFRQILAEQHIAPKIHVNITGGEPFMHPAFGEMLSLLHENGFTFGILSNGKLPDPQTMLLLQKSKPRFVQLSLEGDKRMNDEVRGAHSFADVRMAVKFYHKLRIPVLISFTLNARNYRKFAVVVRLARMWRVSLVWSDRFLPMRQDGDQSYDLSLNKEMFQQYLEQLPKLKGKWYSRLFKTKVSSDRALQFLSCGGKPYTCHAGRNLLSILPNGDVYPCRRLPIFAGNAFTQEFSEIYFNAAVCVDLKNDDNIPQGCEHCHYLKSCRGGLRCLSYAQTGDMWIKDPHCPLSNS